MNDEPRYTIAVAEGLRALESVVNQHIAAGYLPCGGFATGVINDRRWFYQPMLRPT